MIKWFKVARYERAFLFRDRDFVGVLSPGRYFYLDPLFRRRVEIVDVTGPLIESERLDAIVKSGALGDEAVVVDLTDGSARSCCELEVLEKVADKAKLSIVLGDGGLTEKVVKLL